MNDTPPLTREIGKAERMLQAVLATRLEKVGIDFPQWTLLVFASRPGQVERQDLVAGLVGGRIIGETEAGAFIDRGLADGLLEQAGGRIGLGPVGLDTYTRLRAEIDALTDKLFDGLPAPDLEATRRTLGLVAQRAQSLLVA